MPVLDVEREREEIVPVVDPIEEHVRRVLASPSFVRADTQRRLLDYLWQHRAENLSEYALATDALGRKTDFDSGVDASVRVHISRLRRKLKDYYLETGEPEQLTIPVGTHQLVVDILPVLVPPPEEPVALPAPETQPRQFAPWFFPLLLAALFLGMCVAALAGWWIGHRSHTRAATQPTTFWSGFLGQNTAPIKIILPTPTFFRFANDTDLRLRSTRVNDFEDANRDPAFRALTTHLGVATLEQHYTVTSDTMAAVSMVRYLDTFGGLGRVSFDVMRDSDMMVLEQSNVIALGTYQTLHPLRQYLEAMNFSLNHDELAAINEKPLPGEEAIYPMVQESPERVIRPSVIAVLPGRSPGLQVLLIESRDTEAIVTLLSSQAGANSMEKVLRDHGSPKFWEMVVNTELNNEKPLRTWPVALHAYTRGAPSSAM